MQSTGVDRASRWEAPQSPMFELHLQRLSAPGLTGVCCPPGAVAGAWLSLMSIVVVADVHRGHR